jgi:hypothetical protein
MSFTTIKLFQVPRKPIKRQLTEGRRVPVADLPFELRFAELLPNPPRHLEPLILFMGAEE